MGSYQEYTYPPRAARGGVRKLKGAQGTVSLGAYKQFRYATGYRLSRIPAKRGANDKLTDGENPIYNSNPIVESHTERNRIAAKRDAKEKLTAKEEASTDKYSQRSALTRLDCGSCL